MPANPPDMPPEALAAARRVVDALHEQVVNLAAGLRFDTPMAVDMGEEREL
jgi:hypothetical protein